MRYCLFISYKFHRKSRKRKRRKEREMEKRGGNSVIYCKYPITVNKNTNKSREANDVQILKRLIVFHRLDWHPLSSFFPESLLMSPNPFRALSQTVSKAWIIYGASEADLTDSNRPVSVIPVNGRGVNGRMKRKKGDATVRCLSTRRF